MNGPEDTRRPEQAPDAAETPPSPPKAPAPPEATPNSVEEASLESFPASDPPAWIHTRGD